ncbi:MAG: DNA polymerase III subunit beta [Castellaniella sp.]
MQLLKAPRDQLLRPLMMVSGIVERRHTLPILANVLIRKLGSQVSLVASDIEVQITTQLDHGVDETGVETTVAARKLLDILRALPESSDVEVQLVDGRLSLLSGKSRFALQTLDAADFPAARIPAQWDVSLTMTQKALKHLFNNVHYAMAQQDIRYYLNGLLLVFQPGRVLAVATDGHRLAHDGVAVDGVAQALDIIVPRKTVLEMQRLLEDSDEPVHIDVGGNQIRFRFAGIELISKLVEGKFPDFTRVIPSHYQCHFNVGRERLQGSLQRAAILAADRLKGVRLEIADGLLTISATNAEQEEAREEIEIEYAHAPIDVGFNVTYLLDVLGGLRGDMVRWSVEPGQNSSVLITSPDDDQFKYVVMPMRI